LSPGRRLPGPSSLPPATSTAPLPLAIARASCSSPCWRDRLCVRRAPSVLQPTMLLPRQLRYDSRPSNGQPTASLSSIGFISCLLAVPWAFPASIDFYADALVAQRSVSTSSSTAEGKASSWKTNALPVGATAFAIGTIAWYAQFAGRDVDAMTPAEEG